MWYYIQFMMPSCHDGLQFFPCPSKLNYVAIDPSCNAIMSCNVLFNVPSNRQVPRYVDMVVFFAIAHACCAAVVVYLGYFPRAFWFRPSVGRSIGPSFVRRRRRSPPQNHERCGDSLSVLLFVCNALALSLVRSLCLARMHASASSSGRRSLW